MQKDIVGCTETCQRLEISRWCLASRNFLGSPNPSHFSRIFDVVFSGGPQAQRRGSR